MNYNLNFASAKMWSSVAFLLAIVASAQAYSSTVRVNYYKSLYQSEAHRLIECSGLALLADLEASAATCNGSDTSLEDVFDRKNCTGRGCDQELQQLPKATSETQTNMVRNVSLEMEFSFRMNASEMEDQSQFRERSSRGKKGKQPVEEGNIKCVIIF